MPTVPVYNRQVQQQTLPSFRVQPTANEDTFGAGLGRTVSAIGDEAFKVAQQEQAKLNQIAVANAMANTQKTLLPLQNDLLSKQGTNALGTAETKDSPARPAISQDFQSQSNSIYQNTLDSLSNDTQKNNYKMMYQSMYPGMYQSVLNHEKKQIEVAHTAANESQLNASSESFTSNVLMGNYAQANTSLRAGITLSDSMGSINGIPKEMQEENHKKYIYGNIGKTVDILLANNRPEDAKKLVDYYGDKLPESQKSINMAKINPSLEKNETFNYVESLKSDSTFRNPDGTLNGSKMLEVAKAKYLSKTRTVTKQGAPTEGDFESFVNAISGQESGGNYEAVNARTGAAGKFQIMPENWAPWSKQAGLPEGSSMTPENQEVVARHMLKQLYDAHGARGAAIAWYGGEGALSYSEEAKSRKQGAGDEPSINEYADSILGRMVTTTGTTTESISAPDLVGLQLVTAQINQAVAESNAQHKQSLDNAFYEFDNYIMNNKPTTYAEVENAARQFGFQGPDLLGAISKGLQMRGIIKQEENEQSAAAYEGLLGKIYNGEITTKGEIDTYAGVIPYSKLIPLANSFKKEMKWASPENMLAFNGIMKEKGLSGAEQGRVYEKMNQRAAELISKGLTPTVEDIIELATDQSQKVVIGRNAIGWGKETYKGNIPDNWTRTQYGVLDAYGNEVVYKDGQWQVKE
jgi:hypothetical protein